jgi:hypothetical protein
MKSTQLAVSAILFFSSLFFISCSPDLPYVSTTKEVITQGTWSVDYYYYGADKTAQYQNYVFNFSTTGVIKCTNGADVYEGSWSTVKDPSRTDLLTLSLDNQQPVLGELNGTWNITTINISNVAMKNGSNTQLIFKKL